MPKIRSSFKELEKLNRDLRTLAADAEKVLKYSLFDGAKVAADELRSSVDGLTCIKDTESIAAWRSKTPTILNASQKAGLQNGLGINPMRSSGAVISVKIGFDGYNSIVTRRWPRGQPNIMIAASCEHGSSAMLEQPFIRPAFVSCRNRIVAEMEQTCKKKITEILDE